MSTTTSKTTYRITNEFHGYDETTTSERQVKRLVRASRPSDCKSRTYIYRVEDGKTVGRVDFDGDKLRDM